LKREEKILDNIMKNSALLPPLSNFKRFPLHKREREREREMPLQPIPMQFMKT
jgi:hypothetical protein